MSDIRVGRLRKLSKHLRGTHRAHKKFDFGVVADGKLNKKGNYCGSVGCAMGEFPAVWPNEWRWFESDFTNLTNCIKILHKSQGEWNYDSSWRYIDLEIIANFFSITVTQVEHLFTSLQDTDKFGGQDLDSSATAEDVADNIDAFIKKFAS